MGNDTRKDRVLGDEWKDWDAALDPGAGNNTEEKRKTFFCILFLLLLFTVFFAYFALYLVKPRLALLSGTLDTAVTASVIILTTLLIIWYLMLLFAVVNSKSTIFSKGVNKKILLFLIDRTLKLGSKLGISRDRMANSFLKVFNRVIEQNVRPHLPLKPLLILPRCLNKDSREPAQRMAQKYDLDSFVVAGGEAAKEKIKQRNPQAIIAVACERDLLSGIKEVAIKIPVIGIANRRPSGPCKDTEIDLNELERAIRYFLGV